MLSEHEAMGERESKHPYLTKMPLSNPSTPSAFAHPAAIIYDVPLLPWP
jgi:hypothetical protein